MAAPLTSNSAELFGSGDLRDYIKASIDEGVSLRRRGDEEDAFLALGYAYAELRDRGVFQVEGVADNLKEGLLPSAIELALEYAATCTQHSFAIYDESWHGVSISIEKTSLDIAEECIKLLDAGAEEYVEAERLCYRAENALGLSLQRPFSRYRDTGRAVEYTEHVYDYYFQFALDWINSRPTEGDASDVADRDLVDQAIRRCGNYPSALYQRGVDERQNKSYKEAIKDLRSSLKVREEVESKLVRPFYGDESERVYRSQILRANTCQEIARCGKRLFFRSAKMKYERAISGLEQLKKHLIGPEIRSACVTISRGKYGLGWCLVHTGHLDEGLSYLEGAYAERRWIMGDAHIDTVKALDAVGRVKGLLKSKEASASARGGLALYGRGR